MTTSYPAPHVETPRRHDEPAFNPWLIRIPVLFLAGSLLLAVILFAAVVFFQLRARDRILPGVSAYGLDLGGMTPAEAVMALETHFTYDDDAVFTFTLPGTEQFWQVTAGDLGVTMDAQVVAAQAFAIGHSDSFVGDVADQALTWLNGDAIAPDIRYDQGAATTWLNVVAREVDQPARDASLRIDGTLIETTPAQLGRSVDVSSTLAALDSAITNLEMGGQIPLVVNTLQPLATDAESAAMKARLAIASPITLTAEDRLGNPIGPWTITPAQIAALLRPQTVQNPDGTYSFDVTVDTSVYRSSVEALAAGLIVPERDGRFHFDTATSQLVAFQSAIDGRALNVEETLARIQTAVFSSQRTVPLAFSYTPPRYYDGISAAELGITQLVSEGVSYYGGSSAARQANILQAVSRIDGTLIAPGEEFSFNRTVGDISPESGFVEGFVISGGRTITGVGGGVCQVSTTVFRAAFYGGFPFNEWHSHGYRVGYYEQGSDGVGMDAAIYTPDLDLRFINDTTSYLLLEAYADPVSASVRVRLYGADNGRRVEREGPTILNQQSPLPTRYEVNPDLSPGQSLQVDWAVSGAYVEVFRTIYDTTGSVIRRENMSRQYQPWGAIVQVAPGDARAGT